MARNDIYVNINASSPADAIVTAQQDMTAATIPELVLGDTPTFNFYFTDNTNVWPSWAGNAAYTLTWALSDAVGGDFAPASTTSNAIPITGGWAITLPLNAYDLVGLMNTKRFSQAYPVTNLWQQLRVADPSGNEVTRAMFWTPVRYRAISDTQNTESASPTGTKTVIVGSNSALISPTAANFYAANPVPASALPLGLGTDTAPANGELLIGNGSGYVTSTLTAGEGITITNAAGAITIDASIAQGRLTATVKNAEATPITKGQVVYLFGATGNTPSVKLAYNTTDATSAKTFGVVETASIAANGTGTVVCVGEITGLNLGAYQEGDTLYLGATPGSVTATKPYAPNHLVYVGIVEKANAGAGELYVKVQNGYELDEIHDVQITSAPAAGAVLIRDATNSLWKAARLTAGTNIAITNGDASASIAFSGTLPVASGGTGVTTSTGSGSVVLSTSPSLTTPSLGAATATSINSTTIPSSKTLVVTTDKLSALAATTSSELAGVISDETGTGALVFANTPTLVTPNIGAATGTSFNLTGSGTLGTTLVVNSTTDSSSKDTGAIVTEGGLGVEKSATIGGNLTVSGTTFSVSNASDVSGSIKTTGTGNAATLALESGNGTTSARYAYHQLKSLESSAQTWNLGMYGEKAFSIRDGSTPFLTIANSTGAATLAGNLTVSGTGNSSVAGFFGVGFTSPSGYLHTYGSSANHLILQNTTNSGVYARFLRPNQEYYLALDINNNGGREFSIYDATANAIRLTLTSGGNLLLGTTTDAGEKLQVNGTGSFTGLVSSGVITMNKSGGNSTAVDGNFGQVILRANSLNIGYACALASNTDNGGYIIATPSQNRSVAYLGSNGSAFIQTNNGTTALTLDSSQNCTVVGYVRGANVVASDLGSSDKGFFGTAGGAPGVNHRLALVRTDTPSGGSALLSAFGAIAFEVGATTGLNNGTRAMTITSTGKVNMSSLPTSSSGLSAGDIWNDSGTLKIV